MPGMLSPVSELRLILVVQVISHQDRAFMGRFTDGVEQVAESKHTLGYHNRVADSESASIYRATRSVRMAIRQLAVGLLASASDEDR